MGGANHSPHTEHWSRHCHRQGAGRHGIDPGGGCRLVPGEKAAETGWSPPIASHNHRPPPVSRVGCYPRSARSVVIVAQPDGLAFDGAFVMRHIASKGDSPPWVRICSCICRRRARVFHQKYPQTASPAIARMTKTTAEKNRVAPSATTPSNIPTILFKEVS